MILRYMSLLQLASESGGIELNYVRKQFSQCTINNIRNTEEAV